MRFLLLSVMFGISLTGCDMAMLASGDTGSFADGEVSLDEMTGPEARHWLKTNENESALASNRFGVTENAVKFVGKLYDAGAVKVFVPQETIEDDGFGWYSDSLVVVLPQDTARRSQVKAICDREIRREGFDPEEDNGDRIFLWWD